MKKLFANIKNIVLIFFVCFALPFFVFGFLSNQQNVKFENGFRVCGVDLSNLTLEQAEQKLRPLDEGENEIELTIAFGQNNWHFDKNDFVVNSNIHSILSQLDQTNHNLSWRKKRLLMKKIKSMGFENKVAATYVLVGIEQKIDEIASEIFTPATDASAKWNDAKNAFDITPSKQGFELDKAKLYSNIVSALSNSKSAVVECTTTPIEPQFSTEQIKKALVKQSSFSTSYASSNSARKGNIKLACQALNNTCILPGQTFSFNQIIGKRTIEKGYKEANIIKDGKFVKGIGGGVCQVSTTLYNALLLANINVTESHKHSLPVSYVSAGFDAMVSWGSADLKFDNTTDLPIFVVAHADGNKIKFDIFSNTKDAATSIKLRTEKLKTMPATNQIIPDTTGKFADRIVFKGEFVRVKHPKDGYEVKTFVDTYKNGVLVSSNMLRHATYEAQNGIVYEGTEPLPEGLSIPKNNISFVAEN